MAKRKVKTENEVIWGKEPTFNKHSITERYNIEVSNALTWYRNVASNADKKRWLTDWVTTNMSDFDTDLLKNIPDEFVSTIGSFARMMNNGFVAKESDIIKIKDRVSQLAGKYLNVDPNIKEEIKKPANLIKEEKLSPFYTMYDLYIDGVNAKITSLNTKLAKIDINELKKYYTEQLELIENNKSDYNNVDVLIKRHNDIIADISNMDLINTVSKKTRTRKKKSVANDKLVAKLNYQPHNSEYNIVSINPEKIIGANTVLIFNTKNRQLQIYNSVDGLTVNGSTIKNFESSDSYGKTIRDPNKILPQLTAVKKSAKIIEDINSVKKELTGRVNKECIILKAW